MDTAIRALLAAALLGSVLAVCSAASHIASEHHSRQSAAIDERGTAANPLAVTVTQPPQTPEQAREEANERDEKRSNDRKTVALTERIANLTFWLAVIGGIQALIFVLQLIAFAFQAKRLKQTIDSVELTERAYIFADVQFTVFDAGQLLGEESKGTAHAVVNGACQ